MKTNRIFKPYLTIVLIFFLVLSPEIKAQSGCYIDVADIEIANQSENSIFVHPNHPNIVINGNNSVSGVDVFISTDWGETWPFTHNPEGWVDPSVAIDLYGRYYVTHITNQFGGPVLISYSDDGTIWANGTITEMGSDQPYLWVDNNCSSSYKNRLYCSWGSERTEVHRYPEGIYTSYSTDQGETWSSAVQISQGSPWLSGSVLRTDAQGNIYATWRISTQEDPFRWDEIGFSASTDGGVTWSNISNQFPYSISGFSNLLFGGGQSAMAVNQQTGEIYIMWSSRTEISSIYQIYLIKSTDGGINWSTAPILIEQDNTVDNTFPSLTCDHETGVLACVYYSESNNNYDTYLAISTNSGTNWCNLKINDETGSGFSGGDYIGISMSKGVVYPVWSSMLNNLVYTFTSPVDVINRNFVHSPRLSGNKFVAANSITTSGDYSSFSQSNLSFEAGYYIDLTDGFQIDEGENFTASIMYCPPGGAADNLFVNSYRQNKIINKNTYSKNKLMPEEFTLHQNYPNPFNSSTVIRYDLKENIEVKIVIYDVLGSEVKKLVDEFKNAGYQSVMWDGTNNSGKSVSSGLYFYKIKAGDFVASKKLIVIK